MTTDARFMQAALRLARRNLGQTWPNPAVGAVVVSREADGFARIAGTGSTARGGRPHAERVALEMAGEGARGATCYVTLEPCSHHGKTPPCSRALIASGISRVVIGIGDPDARVAGQGIAQLRAAGIAVETGVCAQDCALVTAGHILRVSRRRPFVTLKMALSADGKFAGQGAMEIPITGAQTRARVHMMRATHDAILVGRNTVAADDPQLTCRLPGMVDRSPVRVVLDSGFSLGSGIAMLAEGPEVWVAGLAAHAGNAAALEAAGARIVPVEGAGARLDVRKLLNALADSGITRLMVEGGGEVAGAFLDSGVADEIVIARSPRSWAQIAPGAGAGRDVPQLAALAQDGDEGAYEPVETSTAGDDTLTVLRRRGLLPELLAAGRS